MSLLGKPLLGWALSGALVFAFACNKGEQTPASTPEPPPAATSAKSAPENVQKEPGKVVAIGGDKTRVIHLADRKAAESPEYTVVLDAPEALAPGAEGAFKVHLTPKAGWKLNKEFPTKLSFQAPGGVELPAASMGVAEAKTFEEKKGATWQMGFKVSQAGDVQLKGDFKFAVCTDTVCDPKREKLAFTVAVRPAAAKGP